MYLDAADLRDRPLEDNKATLAKALGRLGGPLRLSDSFEAEGVMSEPQSAPYRSGRARTGSSRNAPSGRNS